VDRIKVSDMSKSPLGNYWQDKSHTSQRSEMAADLPQRCDAVVVGGGYTGLMAAAELAKGGVSTFVLDSGAMGAGCSGRNGGQVGTTIKPSFEKLSASYGHDRAVAIKKVGIDAYAALRDLVASEALDVDWQEDGRFLAAHSDAHFDSLCKTLTNQPQGAAVPYQMVSKAELPDYLGSPSYVGGALYPMAASVQPTKLVTALADRAQQAGATLCANTPVTKLTPLGSGIRVTTDRGDILADKVLVATNGYTSKLTPWLRRRVIPIASAIIATEEMDPGLIRQLIPGGRAVVDTRKLVVYFRASPDGRRILFGGRASVWDLPPAKAAPRLVDMLRFIYPQLDTIKTSHAWSGTVAYTFDELPHVGVHKGIHYAMGYCGSGVALSTYLGKKIGLQMLGAGEGTTPLDGLTFQTRPLYTGTPWFMAAAVAAYRITDRLSAMNRTGGS